MPPMHRPYEHYHYRTQLTLFVIGLVGYFLLSPAIVPAVPHRVDDAVCVLLIIQFGLKRKARPPPAVPGFPVLPPRQDPTKR